MKINMKILSLHNFHQTVQSHVWICSIYAYIDHWYLSIKAPVCQWVNEWVCLFGCSLTPPKRRNFEILWDDSPWDGEGFRLKNTWIRQTVSRKITCIVGMYTSDPSGQFYSLQYESSTYLRGWWGMGRLISDRMSYRNHYMCSGEATSV